MLSDVWGQRSWTNSMRAITHVVSTLTAATWLKTFARLREQILTGIERPCLLQNVQGTRMFPPARRRRPR